jgi:hypothetical protein
MGKRIYVKRGTDPADLLRLLDDESITELALPTGQVIELIGPDDPREETADLSKLIGPLLLTCMPDEKETKH